MEKEQIIKKALIHNPIFVTVHPPIQTMMRTVLEGKSQSVGKTLKKTLTIISEILGSRIDLLANPTFSENFMNLD